MLKNAIESGKFPETDKKDSSQKEHKEEFFEQENLKTETRSEPKHTKKEEKKKSADRETDKEYKKVDTDIQKSIHLYKIFKLNYGCSKEELKDSYRNLLKKYHPDNFEGFPETQKMAERKTRELISAFNKLLELIG